MKAAGMITVKHWVEWLYYGFWYWVAWYLLDLPRWITHNKVWLRRPCLWIVSTGWVFAYLPTLEERKAIAKGEGA